jgi:hypothetical protein
LCQEWVAAGKESKYMPQMEIFDLQGSNMSLLLLNRPFLIRDCTGVIQIAVQDYKCRLNSGLELMVELIIPDFMFRDS